MSNAFLITFEKLTFKGISARVSRLAIQLCQRLGYACRQCFANEMRIKACFEGFSGDRAVLHNCISGNMVKFKAYRASGFTEQCTYIQILQSRNLNHSAVKDIRRQTVTSKLDFTFQSRKIYIK